MSIYYMYLSKGTRGKVKQWQHSNINASIYMLLLSREGHVTTHYLWWLLFINQVDTIL